MLRFKTKELLAKKSFDEGRRITWDEVAKECGVSRPTLSKIANTKGYVTVTSNIDSLCAYFNCTVSDLLEYIPDEPDDK